MKETNLIIIGSGPGGYRAAGYAAKNGLSVVVVEERNAGGTCLNEGCIPTKTMCHEAEKLDALKRIVLSATFSLSHEQKELAHYAMAREGAQKRTINFSHVKERLQEVVEPLRSGVESLMASPGITFIHGHASFKDAKTVTVTTIDAEGKENNEDYTADNIIIATGSSPQMPPVEGLNIADVMTSTDILKIESVPEKLVIVGAGVIGMEFASIFNRFGSKVTVIEFLKECLPAMDGDVAKRLRKALEKNGVEFYMQSAVKTVNGKEVTFERKGKSTTVTADAILMATGRKPNINGLNLEAAGVEYGRKGITVDEEMRTNIPNIYAIGDVNGRMMLAHAATMQGFKAVNSILGKEDKIRLNIMPAAVFTHPEAAGVGLTEEQCKAEGINAVCKKAYYRANGKALAIEETEGIVKLIANEDGKIIGCHALGAHAADMVQEIAALMNKDTTVTELQDMVHIHPTLGELVQDAALQ